MKRIKNLCKLVLIGSALCLQSCIDATENLQKNSDSTGAIESISLYEMASNLTQLKSVCIDGEPYYFYRDMSQGGWKLTSATSKKLKVKCNLEEGK